MTSHLTPGVTVLLLVVIAVCMFLAYHLGAENARNDARQIALDAASARCRTCEALVAPALRLIDAGARISGVEFYGDYDKSRDPVEDANAIIRTAKLHTAAVRRHERFVAEVG